MSKQRNDGQSSRPLNKSVIYEAIYQTNIVTPEGLGNLREGYLQWGKNIYTKEGYRYWWYRDGDKIYKISSLQASPQPYIWYGNNPSPPPGAPPTYANVPTGGNWNVVTTGSPPPTSPATLVSSTPHGLIPGDNIFITSTDGTSYSGKVNSVTDSLNIITDITHGALLGHPALQVHKNDGHSGYITYIDNGTLYIKYWDPTIQNADGSFGNYRVELPKAAVLDQKIEFVFGNETETTYTDPTLPKAPLYYRHIPVASGVTNSKGEDLYDIVVNTPLSIHSAVRYNSHILRAATGIPGIGVNGEYFYENDKPQSGQSVITIARQPQVADWASVMF